MKGFIIMCWGLLIAPMEGLDVDVQIQWPNKVEGGCGWCFPRCNAGMNWYWWYEAIQDREANRYQEAYKVKEGHSFSEKKSTAIECLVIVTTLVDTFKKNLPVAWRLKFFTSSLLYLKKCEYFCEERFVASQCSNNNPGYHPWALFNPIFCEICKGVEHTYLWVVTWLPLLRKNKNKLPS
jgi:hypothetical protein